VLASRRAGERWREEREPDHKRRDGYSSTSEQVKQCGMRQGRLVTENVKEGHKFRGRELHEMRIEIESARVGRLREKWRVQRKTGRAKTLKCKVKRRITSGCYSRLLAGAASAPLRACRIASALPSHCSPMPLASLARRHCRPMLRQCYSNTRALHGAQAAPAPGPQ